MVRTLEDFVGTYTIRYGAENRDFTIRVRPGFLLAIGTGAYGDPESDGIRVGVSVYDPDQNERVVPAVGNPPALAYLVDGTLNGSSYWPDPDDGNQLKLLSYQISLLTTTTDDGGLFKAPSIMITIGDPETAGVWGADDDDD